MTRRHFSLLLAVVIAAHKSQGVFQMDAGRHNVERFWRFDASGPDSQEAARRLFERLSRNVKSPAHQEAVTR